MTVPSHWLQLMTDVVGNPEEERRAAFYHEPWSQEAVSRYFYCKVKKLRLKLSAFPSQYPHNVRVFTSLLLATDPAEEAGAGTGLSGPQHLSRDPPEVLHLILELRVCVRVCVCEAKVW